jgi:hypothetical protein
LGKLVQIFRSRFCPGPALRFPRITFRYALFIISAVTLLSTSAFATPTEEISRAVAVHGVADISTAQPKQFLKAFTAIALRTEARRLPEYVIAATNLRPDLASNIVRVAIQAAGKNWEDKPRALCAIIDRIVKAAIAANPDAVVAVVSAAASTSPQLRHCVVNAAISAAPMARDAIVQAATAKTVPFAFLSFSTSDQRGFSYAAPTLNPANISDLEDDNVNSPEQPPTP